MTIDVPQTTHSGALPLPSDAVPIGYCLGAYGVKGAVRVKPLSPDPINLLSSKVVYVTRGTVVPASTCTEMSVVEARFHGESALISLSGVAERNAAQALKGTTFLVTRSRLTPPQLDEYYWIDLIGCEVCTLLGVSLGKVDSLLSTGAHDVLSIQTVEHGETRTRLIPFVNAYVKKVDVRKKQISVEWDPAWD